MNISELIKKLEEIKQKKGDLEVMVDTSGEDNLHLVCGVISRPYIEDSEYEDERAEIVILEAYFD